MNNAAPLFQCQGLEKYYQDTVQKIQILSAVDFSLEPGERVAIIGPSGSGKSTFLHLLGGLDPEYTGQLSICGQDWRSLSEKKRSQFRNQYLGFVYQFHHLLPECTAFENIALPWLLRGKRCAEIAEMVNDLLLQVGLQARAEHKPSELSGGERQRVAIARALVHKPRCILADEPTGNLDRVTAQKVLQCMLDLNRQSNTALVLVTHDLNIARCMDTLYSIKDQQLVRVSLEGMEGLPA
ncbi:MAG: ATP-binding cassette domain-containing protein [Legionellaceae bacterium]|nr:ATP-binding cassette domain-containing protein [Legionellaceae bacterium]